MSYRRRAGERPFARPNYKEDSEDEDIIMGGTAAVELIVPPGRAQTRALPQSRAPAISLSNLPRPVVSPIASDVTARDRKKALLYRPSSWWNQPNMYRTDPPSDRCFRCCELSKSCNARAVGYPCGECQDAGVASDCRNGVPTVEWEERIREEDRIARATNRPQALAATAMGLPLPSPIPTNAQSLAAARARNATRRAQINAATAVSSTGPRRGGLRSDGNGNSSTRPERQDFKPQKSRSASPSPDRSGRRRPPAKGSARRSTKQIRCKACAVAKRKCDEGRPCGQCRKRGIICQEKDGTTRAQPPPIPTAAVVRRNTGRCARCAHLRQACSPGRPCDRCIEANVPCVPRRGQPYEAQPRRTRYSNAARGGGGDDDDDDDDDRDEDNYDDPADDDVDHPRQQAPAWGFNDNDEQQMRPGSLPAAAGPSSYTPGGRSYGPPNGDDDQGSNGFPPNPSPGGGTFGAMMAVAGNDDWDELRAPSGVFRVPNPYAPVPERSRQYHALYPREAVLRTYYESTVAVGDLDGEGFGGNRESRLRPVWDRNTAMNGIAPTMDGRREQARTSGQRFLSEQAAQVRAAAIRTENRGSGLNENRPLRYTGQVYDPPRPSFADTIRSPPLITDPANRPLPDIATYDWDGRRPGLVNGQYLWPFPQIGPTGDIVPLNPIGVRPGDLECFYCLEDPSTFDVNDLALFPGQCGKYPSKGCEVLPAAQAEHRTNPFWTCLECHEDQLESWESEHRRQIGQTKLPLCLGCARKAEQQGLVRPQCVCTASRMTTWLCHAHRESVNAQFTPELAYAEEYLIRIRILVGQGINMLTQCPGCYRERGDESARVWSCKLCRQWFGS